MDLYGEFLSDPILRFNYSSSYAQDSYARRGVSKYGPYDSGFYGKNKITAAILYPKDATYEKDILINGLLKGEGTFKGFSELFRVQLDITDVLPYSSITSPDIHLNNIFQKNLDFVYMIISQKDELLYKRVKSKLLSNGLPSQMVTLGVLRNSYGRNYTFENIALSTYAKTGGIPWTVGTTSKENNLVLGVSRAMDVSKKYFVGFVTLFTNEGEFIFMHSKAPVIEWSKYLEGLTELVHQAIEEYQFHKGEPKSIIIHFHKNPGRQEVDAVDIALKKINKIIPYALVHINEYSNFRTFDSTDSSFIPTRGLKISLNQREFLLLLDGRIGDRRSKVGVPNVLNIRFDKRSTVSKDKFPEIIKQIYDFSQINWRGFNATAIPVTLNYSKLIARMMIELGVENWNAVVAEGKLRDKSWFL